MNDKNKECIITFEHGLFGFENCKEYTPFFFNEGSDAMFAIDSVDIEGLSFVLMNPFLLKDDYSPKVPLEELKELGELKEEDYCWYVICVTKDPIGDSTVNLKCPIVLNPMTKMAKQVILDDSRYNLRHLLKDLTREENSSC